MIPGSPLYQFGNPRRVQNAAVANTTTIKSSRVDMQAEGADGILFICAMGAINATGTVALKAAQAATDIDGVELASLAADWVAADDNKIGIIDLVRPSKRWVQAWVERGTASSVVDAVIAIPYRLRGPGMPTAHSTQVDRAYAVTPAEV